MQAENALGQRLYHIVCLHYQPSHHINILYYRYFIITTYKNSTQILKELIISIDCKQIQEPNVPKLLKTYVPMQTCVSKFLSI